MTDPLFQNTASIVVLQIATIQPPTAYKQKA